MTIERDHDLGRALDLGCAETQPQAAYVSKERPRCAGAGRSKPQQAMLETAAGPT